MRPRSRVLLLMAGALLAGCDGYEPPTNTAPPAALEATLRNVELTYPYFHDGEAETLSEAVDVMGRLQLGRTFTADENAQVVAFLATLTGDAPRFEMPILPPSAPDTPRPVPFD